MEPGNHFKNWNSVKSLMKKNNIKTVFFLLITTMIYCSCNKKSIDIEDLTYHLSVSEDVLSVYDITVSYDTPHGRISEEIHQSPWGKLVNDKINCQFLASMIYEFKPKTNFPEKSQYLIEYEFTISYTEKTDGKVVKENQKSSEMKTKEDILEPDSSGNIGIFGNFTYFIYDPYEIL